MPSQAQLDELYALEDEAKSFQARAIAAKASGDAAQQKALLLEANLRWNQFTSECYRYAGDTTQVDQAFLVCWAGQGWLAQAAVLHEIGEEFLSRYALRQAGLRFEECGDVRMEIEDPDGAREAFVRAQGCRMDQRRKTAAAKPPHQADEDLDDLYFALETLKDKIANARMASRD